MNSPLISIVVPVYNEGGNIVRFLTELEDSMHEPHETLIVYDFPEDDTVPIVNAMQPPIPSVRLVHNTLGKGVLNAYRAGFAAAKGDVIVTMVSDRADDPKDVSAMVKLVREGADVAAGSRYMKGGRQIGGPAFKQFLSRMAGLSLYYCAGMPTHDSTNNFRAYSRRILELPIESEASFALGIELVVKAFERGWTITEIPTTWHDRTIGASRFRLWAWLPQYLRWYFRGMRHAWLKSKVR
jgi:dolichol-phosphate mannosyltransferase